MTSRTWLMAADTITGGKGVSLDEWLFCSRQTLATLPRWSLQIPAQLDRSCRASQHFRVVRSRLSAPCLLYLYTHVGVQRHQVLLSNQDHHLRQARAGIKDLYSSKASLPDPDIGVWQHSWPGQYLIVILQRERKVAESLVARDEVLTTSQNWTAAAPAASNALHERLCALRPSHHRQHIWT